MSACATTRDDRVPQRGHGPEPARPDGAQPGTRARLAGTNRKRAPTASSSTWTRESPYSMARAQCLCQPAMQPAATATPWRARSSRRSWRCRRRRHGPARGPAAGHRDHRRTGRARRARRLHGVQRRRGPDQGSLRIEADRLTIFHDRESADRIVAVGEPARLRQQPAIDKEPVRASAGASSTKNPRAVVLLASPPHRAGRGGGHRRIDPVPHGRGARARRRDAGRRASRVQVFIPPR
jgi:hypothetical protein